MKLIAILVPLGCCLILIIIVLWVVLSQDDSGSCQSRYSDSITIDQFKHIYDERFRDTHLPNTPSAFGKEMQELLHYFGNSSCGKMVVEPETGIVNGTDAPEKAWPWQTLIHGESSRCGGVLISNRWVLSAAHCFKASGTYSIELGMRIMGPEWGESAYTRVAENVIVHNEYESYGWFNDIALLKMDKPVRFTDMVMPACLPLQRTDFNESHVCYVTGFGKGAPDADDHRTLQQLRVYVVSVKECVYLQRIVTRRNLIDTRRICAAKREKAGACDGDSGGPLSCKHGGKYYVAGIASYVDKSCMSDIAPDVFSRVSGCLHWIFTVIKKHKL